MSQHDDEDFLGELGDALTWLSEEAHTRRYRQLAGRLRSMAHEARSLSATADSEECRVDGRQNGTAECAGIRDNDMASRLLRYVQERLRDIGCDDLADHLRDGHSPAGRAVRTASPSPLDIEALTRHYRDRQDPADGSERGVLQRMLADVLRIAGDPNCPRTMAIVTVMHALDSNGTTSVAVN